MTYLDGIHAGLYVLGVLTPLAIVAIVALLTNAIGIPHRMRVAKLRRDVRRAGRTTPVDPPFVYGERYEG